MVIIIPIVIGALKTIPKSLVKGLKDLEIRGQVESIQTSALLRSARIPRRWNPNTSSSDWTWNLLQWKDESLSLRAPEL